MKNLSLRSARRGAAGLAAVMIVLSACGDRDARTASVSRPMLMTGFPRFSSALPMSDAEVSCRRELKRLGVAFRDIDPISEGQCGVDHPVEVNALPGGVALEPAATLNCHLALAFSTWVKKELQPAARKRYFSGVARIRQGSSYACRNMNGARETQLSEHATGNALDVMAIELNNGREIDVRKPGLFSFRERGLLNTVRGDACAYFSTVLGPGYNREHKDHFHFDLRPRKGGKVSCL